MPFPVPGRTAELLRRSTLQIRFRSGGAQAGGSGIALTDGRVVTNRHVVAEANGFGLTAEGWDGQESPARVIKTDARRDLALLAVDKLDAPAATLSSGSVRPGQPVIAVGNPLGFVGAVSTGFVQRVGPVRQISVDSWIQADLRLAPGNSGGPLADIHGQIVGVNTMIAGRLALAIPVSRLQAFLSERAPHRLGVSLRPVIIGSAAGGTIRRGLILLGIDRNGPADRASLMLGDVLIAAGPDALEDPDDLTHALSACGTLTLGFLRGGSPTRRSVTVQLTGCETVNAA